MRYNEFGEELPDDTPVEIPLRFRRARPPSIQELIALYVRNEQALARVSGRGESEEEEDFDVDEDGDEDIMTPYELHALAADTEREYASRARRLVRDKEADDGAKRVESAKGAGSDSEARGKAEAAKGAESKVVAGDSEAKS